MIECRIKAVRFFASPAEDLLFDLVEVLLAEVQRTGRHGKNQDADEGHPVLDVGRIGHQIIAAAISFSSKLAAPDGR